LATFESARIRAEFEEAEYRGMKVQREKSLAALESENEAYRPDNDYFRQYAKELTATLKGITN
jgi:hypothetical protein